MGKVITSPGVYRDVSIEDYHADKSWISSTGLKHAKKSMSEYRMFLDGYWDEETKLHFDFGNAVELHLVNEEVFEDRVAIMPTEKWVMEALDDNKDLKNPKASKVYKELLADWMEDNEGKYIIPDVGDQSYETLQVITARCKADPYLAPLLSQMQIDTSIYWIDKETGLKLKTRPDLVLPEKRIGINIKSATSAAPDDFSKNLVKLDYPIQACIEIDGMVSSGLMPSVDKYFWLVLEKNAPFNAQLYEFDEGDIRVVMDEYRWLLRKLKECYDADKWPGYGAMASNKYGILTAKIPAWYKSFME